MESGRIAALARRGEGLVHEYVVAAQKLVEVFENAALHAPDAPPPAAALEDVKAIVVRVQSQLEETCSQLTAAMEATPTPARAGDGHGAVQMVGLMPGGTGSGQATPGAGQAGKDGLANQAAHTAELEKQQVRALAVIDRLRDMQLHLASLAKP
ncbi:uncharacterized protein AMSG_06821 [Thecamonas trahens ATCC 50062]|uniref:Uncharacterized protein n=1 Tax=Thecamonas trahens ATCC 50062 TaxID=461836 RepID=A0A0L0DDA7_THETB|nr:hypothetical protein AMSG_06821 [Thecamonas trahens ATCC 50062]KNC50337.1 hypothetical protein AMSG_06821 [Thecamonas trahens ATCC 50062]|eukprot:XP_013756883.1 hypothetical protein AMSG_06821 [Thecamonas trahens ATCC 50062]